MMEEEKYTGSDIELRSGEFQEVLGEVPSWILRWGITTIASVIGILLIGSAVFKYPDYNRKNELCKNSKRIVQVEKNPALKV